MRRPLLAAALTAALALALPAIASAAPTLLWSDIGFGDVIAAADIKSDGTGDNARALFIDPRPDLEAPVGVTVDPSTGKVFWGNSAGMPPAGGVYAGDLSDPSQAPALVTSEKVLLPSNIAYNPSNDSVYWVSNATIAVKYAKADGSESSSPNVLAVVPPGNVQGIAIDPANNKIYWATSSGAIRYGNLDGSGSAGTITLSCTPTWTEAFSVAVDPTRGRLYATGYDGTSTYKAVANLDGSSCQQVTPGAFPGSTAANADYVFLADFGIYGGVFGIEVLPVDGFPGATGTAFSSSTAAPSGVTVLDIPAGTATVSPTTAEVGGELTCSASWDVGTPGMQWYRAPQTKTYSWYKDGQPISGATSATFRPDAAGEYTCNATGTNYAGSKTLIASATVSEPPAPTPPAPDPGPTPGPTPGPSNTFTVRTPLLVGTGIRTVVRVPGAGVVRQAGTFRSGGKTRQACGSGAIAVSKAGVYRLRCRLTGAVRSQRRKGAVRVRLVTTYRPTGGTARAKVQTVVLRSLKPRFTG